MALSVSYTLEDYTDTTFADLKTAINTDIAAVTGRQVISCSLAHDGTNYVAHVVYADPA